VTGLGPINQPAAQITVDGHLLAGHRIQAETRGDFRHTLRALGDHQKIDDGNDQKDHQPDGEIAPHHKVAECLDNVTRILLQKDQTGRCNGQRQTKHCGQQQERGERRERQRARQVKRQNDQQAGNTDIDRDQNIY